MKRSRSLRQQGEDSGDGARYEGERPRSNARGGGGVAFDVLRRRACHLPFAFAGVATAAAAVVFAVLQEAEAATRATERVEVLT